MTALPKLRMKADDFLAWAMRQPGGRRCELADGEIVAMSSERAGHTRVKHRIWLSLRIALREGRCDCEGFGDGFSVRIVERTVYEPDALVRCGQPIADDAIETSDPVVVIEVASPSSQALDTGAKLDGYFRLPSVRHYLIVSGKDRTVIHHDRGQDGRIETRVIRSGPLALDPPGVVVQVE